MDENAPVRSKHALKIAVGVAAIVLVLWWAASQGYEDGAEHAAAEEQVIAD